MRWPACNGNCGNWKQQKQITLTSKNASKCHFQNISNHHGPEMSRMPSQKTECSGFEPNHFFFLDNPQWNGKSWARRRPCWGLADPSGRVAKCEAKCWVMCAMQWCNGDSPTSLYKNMVVLVRIHDIHIYIYMLYVYKNMEQKNPGIPIFVTSWFSDWDFWSPKRNSQPKVLYRFCWAPKLMLQAVSKNSAG